MQEPSIYYISSEVSEANVEQSLHESRVDPFLNTLEVEPFQTVSRSKTSSCTKETEHVSTLWPVQRFVDLHDVPQASDLLHPLEVQLRPFNRCSRKRTHTRAAMATQNHQL